MISPFDSILPELWEEIYLFLDDRNCSNFERVCLSFRSICICMEKRKLREHLILESKYLTHPLLDPSGKSITSPVSEEEICIVEERMGLKLPFHLREFIKITDGRESYSEDLNNLHYTNSLKPFKSWRIGYNGYKIEIGGVSHEFEPTDIFINLIDGRMTMDISTYGTTDGITGGFLGYLQMTSTIYDSFNPFNVDKLCENFNDLVKISRYNTEIISYLPEKYKNNLEFMKKLVYSNPATMFSMPQSFRDDINLIKSLIVRRPGVYASVSPRLKKDKDLFDLAVDLDITNFYHGDESFKSRDLALKYCKASPYPTCSCFPADLIDKELVCLFKYFHCVPKQLQTPEIALCFLENGQDVKDEIVRKPDLQTPEVLEALFRLDPIYLFMLKKDSLFEFDTKETALKLFNSHRKELFLHAFKRLPHHLQTDLDVVKAALKNLKIFQLLSEELKKDREIILYCCWESDSSFISNPEFEPFNKELEVLKNACDRFPGVIFSLDKSLVTEEFLNSLKCYHYKTSTFGDVLNKTRFEHYNRVESIPAYDI